ncbi:MAG: cyclomaltodextrinase C-terminal domain-containing protein [Ferruginibacter sp.]
MNTAKEEKKVNMARYAERTSGFSQYRDVINQTTGKLSISTLGHIKR